MKNTKRIRFMHKQQDYSIEMSANVNYDQARDKVLKTIRSNRLPSGVGLSLHLNFGR